MIAQPLPTYNAGPGVFCQYAKALLTGGDALSALAIAEERGYLDAGRIFKSAISAGTTGDATWAAELIPHRIMVGDFSTSLVNVCAFDHMLASMRRVPVGVSAAVATAIAVGSAASEGQLKPVTRLSFDALRLDPRKAVAILVLSRELVRNVSAAGDAMLARTLRNAVAAATDEIYLAELASGATEIASSGIDAAAIYADVAALLAAVPLGADSKPFIIASPAVVGQIAAKGGAGGPSFPAMTPNGGTISGVEVIPSDALVSASAGSTMLMVDAAQVAADSATITLDVSNTASVRMDDAPEDETAVTSLFQSNLTGLKCERIFGFARLRDSAVATLSSVDYSVGS